MGLKELKKIAREKEFEEFLKTFGITKQDLTYLHEALEIVKNNKMNDNSHKPVSMSEEEKQILEKKLKSLSTPQEVLEAMSQDVEEFYPNGKK